MKDPLLQMLANLPQGTPDRARSARIRARCHTALARNRPAAAASPHSGRRPRGAGRVTDFLLAGLGAIYLLETIRQALLLYGIV